MQKDSGFGKFIDRAVGYIKQARFELIVLVAVLALDLISKAIVGATMEEYDSVTLIPKFLHITFSHNENAAFGSNFGLGRLGKTAVRVIFIVISAVATVFFSVIMYRNRGGHKMSRLSFALIIAGALGNLVDRVFLGYVRDFIEFEYLGLTIFGSKTFAIFNFADASLTIGVLLFAIYYLFVHKDKKHDEAAEKSAAAGTPTETGGENPTETPTEADGENSGEISDKNPPQNDNKNSTENDCFSGPEDDKKYIENRTDEKGQNDQNNIMGCEKTTSDDKNGKSDGKKTSDEKDV